MQKYSVHQYCFSPPVNIVAYILVSGISMQRYHFLKKDEGVQIPEGASMPSPSIPHAVPAI
jgi:hypothetical protein